MDALFDLERNLVDVVLMLERATFALPAGTFHALVGGDPAARPLVFLHGFPDHPPTARPFLELLARTRRVIAPWLRGYAPSPRVGLIRAADAPMEHLQHQMQADRAALAP